MKCVLTIAGSDSIGGAGIQADIKTIFSLGLYASSVITAVTAQNSCGVRRIDALSSESVEAQIDAVLEDLSIDAIKIGMIYTPENLLAIRNSIIKNRFQKPIILDPVLVATSGDGLSQELLLPTLIRELFPLCELVTPNLTEAETIIGRKINSLEETIFCGREIIRNYHCKSVLIKGGHREGTEMTDVWIRNDGTYQLFTASKIKSRNTHGTGCTLSSAIASFCALGYPMERSILLAKRYVHRAIESAKTLTLGHGHGSTNHFHNLKFINQYSQDESFN